MRPLVLAHLYPHEMNIYGDTGNVLVLRRRLEWRGLAVEVVPVGVGTAIPPTTDILLGGGGQDAAQGEIGADVLTKGPDLRAMAADGVVMLAICGMYQLLGHEFLTHDGQRIPGVDVLDVVTRGSDTRLIGNHAVDTAWGQIVGYENHSGLTELGPAASALAATSVGKGNNGIDRTEGCLTNNVIGTYLHGPVLAKSPAFADELIARALRRRGDEIDLEPLDDAVALRAAVVAAGRPR
ncbi:MAG: glutamine amidotransferase [Pseudonocardiales bacterium]|nr:glutamine amidotransferase [Jatrophihabitantaceae bacterium]MCW2602423.1 glutamine amidotransferase [Pseudonocardiales bacterium]